MKNKILLIFFLTFLLNFFVLWVSNYFLSIDTKIFDFLAKDYPNDVVQNYMKSQKNGGG